LLFHNVFFEYTNVTALAAETMYSTKEVAAHFLVRKTLSLGFNSNMMPDLLINKQVIYNPVDYVLHLIGGTWKTPVLWRLKNRRYRYTELEKDIPHISQKMLTKALKELEQSGLISREVFAQVPPRTEYFLTPRGQSIIPLIEQIRNEGIRLMKLDGVDYNQLVAAEKKARAAKN
jgi:DNA-binding HxlR family transcriptional regulator